MAACLAYVHICGAMACPHVCIYTQIQPKEDDDLDALLDQYKVCWVVYWWLGPSVPPLTDDLLVDVYGSGVCAWRAINLGGCPPLAQDQ